MVSSFLLVLCLVSFVHWSEGGRWVKLSADEVCFGSQAPSTVANVTYRDNCNNKELFIACVKLVHKSGQFSCGSHVGQANAKWGCSSLKNGYVNVVMSDNRKRIIFPKSRLVSFHGTEYGYAQWYFLPGFCKTSDTLSWCDYASPACIMSGQTFHLSHGEDLKNLIHTYNEGKVCVDVYGYAI